MPVNAAYLSAVAAEAPSMARVGAVASEYSSTTHFSVCTEGAADDDMERLHRQNYLSMAAFVDSLESFEGHRGEDYTDGSPRTHDEFTANIRKKHVGVPRSRRCGRRPLDPG